MYGRAWRMLAVAHTCDTDCGGHMPRTRNAPCCRWGTALRLVPGAQGDSTCKGLVRVPQRRTGTRVFAQEDDEKGSRSTVDSLSRMLEGESENIEKERHVPWDSMPNRGNAPRPGAVKRESDLLEEDRGMPVWYTESNKSRTGRGTQDDEPLDVPTYEPRVAYIALGACLAVYAVGVTIALTAGNEASNEFFLALAKDNDAVARGEVWRLLTSNFMHAGLLHLGLNSFALWQLAVEVESVMGGPTFLAIYLLSGLAGSTASFLTSDLVTVGASGAVLGLVGALGGYFLRNREIENSLRQLLFLAALTSFNLYLGTLPDASIDNAGHIGGLVAGLWLGYSMGPRFAVVKELDVADGAIEFPKEEDMREVRVVVDQSSNAGKIAIAATFAASLGVFVAVGMAVRSEGL